MALDIGVFLDTIKNLFKSKVSSNDSQPDYLINKFTSSDASVTITETNDGGIEQINLQSAASGGNFADTDLTVDADRTHDLAGFNIDYDATSGSVISKQFDDIKPTTPVTLEKWYGSADGANYYYAIEGGGGNSSSASGFVTYYNGIRVASLGFYNNTQVLFNLKDKTGGNKIFFEPDGNSFHIPDMVIGKLSLSPAAKLQVVGNNSTSATTTALFENSSGTDLFEIKDDGEINLNLGRSQFKAVTGEFENNGLITGFNDIVRKNSAGTSTVAKLTTSGGGSLGALEIQNAGTTFSSLTNNGLTLSRYLSFSNSYQFNPNTTGTLKLIDQTNSNEWQFVNWGAFQLPVITVADVGTPVNGMMIYVSDTDATFTSVGIWARENGAWIKL